MGITKANKAIEQIKPPRVKEYCLPKDDGLYYNDGYMEVDKRLKGNYALEVFIHEMLHHYCPEWVEEKVDEVAYQMALVLKAHRFVRVESDNETKYDAVKKGKKARNSRRI